jgi:adenylate cyclase
LLHELLGADPQVGPLAERIHRRTRGNPFFIEEIVQSMVEAGALVGTRGAYRAARPPDDQTLPATVQAVLAGRIDRLGEPEKAVLQTAAVIGKEFSEPLLVRVTGLAPDDLSPAIAALTRAELIHQTALYPHAGYAFKHPLTQEVAYHAQLTERRSTVHAAVAGAIAELAGERPDEHAAAVAYHLDAAGDVLEAARWHRRAAQYAGRGSVADAARHWQRVRALVRSIEHSREAVDLVVAANNWLLASGWRLGMVREEAAAMVAEARALAEPAGDVRSLLAVLMNYHIVLVYGGDLVAGRVPADEMMQLSGRLGDSALWFGSRLASLNISWASGELADALAIAGELGPALLGIQETSDLSLPNPTPVVTLFKGLIFSEMGRMAEATAEIDRSVQLAKDARDDDIIGSSQRWRAIHACRAGDARNALQFARSAVQAAERIGNVFLRTEALHSLGVALSLDGDLDGAVRVLDEVRSVMRERRIVLHLEPHILADSSAVHLERGDVDRARRLADDAVASARARGTQSQEVAAQLALAQALVAGKRPNGLRSVHKSLDRARALIERTGARWYEPFLHLVRARLGGDAAQCRREAQKAHELLVGMDVPLRAEQVAWTFSLGGRSIKRQAGSRKT